MGEGVEGEVGEGRRTTVYTFHMATLDILMFVRAVLEGGEDLDKGVTHQVD